MARLSFKHRSPEKEILDDFNLEGHDLARNLRELERVNTLLGGYSPVRKGLLQIPGTSEPGHALYITDVGCGGGDVLRMLYSWFRKRSVSVNLIGVDGNPNVIALARQLSENYLIEWRVGDVFSEDVYHSKTDILLFNLFLHHFTHDEIIFILKKSYSSGKHILINDLQRSRVAYHLFRLASKVFNFSYISRHDGKLSIRKSFTKKDWHQIMTDAGIKNYKIRWQWAFRYSITIINR